MKQIFILCLLGFLASCYTIPKNANQNKEIEIEYDPTVDPFPLEGTHWKAILFLGVSLTAHEDIYFNSNGKGVFVSAVEGMNPVVVDFTYKQEGLLTDVTFKVGNKFKVAIMSTEMIKGRFADSEPQLYIRQY